MIELDEGAPMRRYQQYIHELEAQKGWSDVDLVHTCFLMGEEVGELFKAVRNHNKRSTGHMATGGRSEVADEIVDVLNCLLAVANRLDIDVEASFRDKNARNQLRHWD